MHACVFWHVFWHVAQRARLLWGGASVEAWTHTCVDVWSHRLALGREYSLLLASLMCARTATGRDIVKALMAEKPKEGTGEVFETENGVEYEDLLVGPPGEGKEPQVGKLVGMTVEVTIADQKFKKNVAFKYGSKPYQSLVCAGLEEGIAGMAVGGRRKLTIPLELAPAGMRLPPGTALIYDVTLNEVFENYLN